MKASYDAALKGLLESEGGYSNDPGDSGGPTKYGITIHDARAYWKSDATANDVKRLPLAVAKEIYQMKYWNQMDCDNLPAGVDYAVFDYGVNSGIGRAAKVLQRLVGVRADGVIGPRTITAARDLNAVRLVNAICDERLKFLRRLGIWRLFGKGWAARVHRVRGASIRMADDRTGTH